MVKLLRIIKFFLIYRKNVLKNREYLSTKYGLNVDRVYRMWTTVTFADAPAEVKEKYGKALAETQMRKYIATFRSDLAKLELDELVNVYEIQRIDDENYGITFGYALARNETVALTALTIALLLVATITLVILL